MSITFRVDPEHDEDSRLRLTHVNADKLLGVEPVYVIVDYSTRLDHAIDELVEAIEDGS